MFISYHHANDQCYKNELIKLGQKFVFEDKSVNDGDINPSLDDQSIRQKIRDEYLKSTTVTIVLMGTETYKRKHVDWEIYSSMYDGQVNKKSGVIGIYLPNVSCQPLYGSFKDWEKGSFFPDISASSWSSLSTKADVERDHPYMPKRLQDNLLENCYLPIVRWQDIKRSPDCLPHFIERSFNGRQSNHMIYRDP